VKILYNNPFKAAPRPARCFPPWPPHCTGSGPGRTLLYKNECCGTRSRLHRRILGTEDCGGRARLERKYRYYVRIHQWFMSSRCPKKQRDTCGVSREIWMVDWVAALRVSMMFFCSLDLTRGGATFGRKHNSSFNVHTKGPFLFHAKTPSRQSPLLFTRWNEPKECAITTTATFCSLKKRQTLVVTSDRS
jgi:hypothetical protein